MTSAPTILSSALATIAFGLVACSTRVVEAATPAKVSFNRDIRPIMSDTCFHCHGFDPKTREAGLRLDRREDAIKPTEDGVVGIVPGQPEKSAIIERIFDNDDPMPPEKAHKPLTAAQQELFRRWVAEGAVYEPHWAYAPIVKPALQEKAHPIDALIQAKLTEKGIKPSAEAPKSKLLRRLSLDLIGLPPTPGETAAFVDTGKEEAYEQQVDRLLASPHFGERMAVWWLDIARFADTVGYHGDQNQRIYPYRDYVIKAFNTNMRFDQFTREQLAGDLLPNPTEEQLTASAYNRLNMMTREGGVQPREFIAKYGAERVRSVAAAWFGSTFGCAECHDHKFDPIKTRDFYELQSFFADVKQWGVYGDYKYTPEPELAGIDNDSPFPPEIEVKSPYLVKRLKAAETALHTQQTAARAKLATLDHQPWLAELRSFLSKHPSGWVSPTPESVQVLDKAAKPMISPKAVISAAGDVDLERTLGVGQSMTITLPCGELPRLAAIRVEVQPDGLATDKPRSVAFTATLQRGDGTAVKLGNTLADATVKVPDYELGAEIIGVAKQWLIPHLPFSDAMHAIWVLDAPAVLKPEDKLVLTFAAPFYRASLCDKPLRIALSPLASLEPLQSASAGQRKAVTALAPTPAEKDLLLDTLLVSAAPEAKLLKQSRDLKQAVRLLNYGRAWTMVTKATDPREVRVLPRGNWQDTTGAVVLPSTPSFLPGRIESTEQRRLSRLDLANWITSKDNPITARAVMNRLWQQFFGVGLSAVVDDLGSQGELPSHPELLDWLASEFRDSGWDMKHMIRLIVTSHTYRQSSSLRPELKESDPANRLLASQNPRRLDAEFVRDNALAIAGVLNLDDIGGPSAKPYQPPGYYEAIQFPDRDYVANTDREQWRRGLYTHWQRTFLHPMMANFDAPARDECAALRTVSNTPQQALTLLNDPTFVEAARLLATRTLDSKNDEQRLREACLLAWSREPKSNEAASLTAFLKTQRDYYQANAAEAKKLLKVGIAPQAKADTAELAAWTSLCRVLLNAQETITRY